jgi:hypothetical protein
MQRSSAADASEAFQQTATDKSSEILRPRCCSACASAGLQCNKGGVRTCEAAGGGWEQACSCEWACELLYGVGSV